MGIVNDNRLETGKLVFFDIDGTLWDWGWIIPQSAKEAITRLKENGHIPIICSGRAKGNIRDKQLLSLGFGGMIASCGGYIEIDGKVLHEQYIPAQTVRKIVGLSYKYNVPIVLEGAKKHWISEKGFEKDGFVDLMYQNLGDDAVTIKGYTPDMNATKFSGDVTVMSDYDSFKNELKGEFQFIRHELPKAIERPDKDLSEILAVFEAVIPGTCKSEGIKKVCEHFGTSPKDAFALGDSANDIDMIKSVGTGIAMGNGSDSIKAVADYITDEVNCDGVYNALKHFGLI